MKEIYRAIKSLNPNLENKVFTVIEGQFAGEKAVLTGDDFIFETDSGFFAGNKNQLKEIKNSGITEINGTKVYCEILCNEKKLVVCGGGHDSIPVIKIALMIGMKVTIFEDRKEFADNAAAAGAKTVLGEYTETLKSYVSDKDTFFVIMTRGHKWDIDCLREISTKPHAYIGMMGSKRRIEIVKSTLKNEGCNADVIDSVCAPIGLKINSETPEEISVSIMAQIIQIKNQENTNFSYPKEILKAFDEQPAVLSTIITRKGSAPRQVGTKMLVKADGNFTGTIGGGSIEADVIKASLEMIKDKAPVKIIHSEMTADEADIEGMVCGGIVDVLLEQA